MKSDNSTKLLDIIKRKRKMKELEDVHLELMLQEKIFPQNISRLLKIPYEYISEVRKNNLVNFEDEDGIPLCYLDVKCFFQTSIDERRYWLNELVERKNPYILILLHLYQKKCGDKFYRIKKYLSEKYGVEIKKYNMRILKNKGAINKVGKLRWELAENVRKFFDTIKYL